MAAKPGKKKGRKTLARKDLKKTRGGAVFLPEVNDEVLVAFQSGDSRKPVVIGSLWKKDPPPESRS